MGHAAATRTVAPGLLLKGLVTVLPQHMLRHQQHPLSVAAAAAAPWLDAGSLHELTAAAAATVTDMAAVPSGRQDLPVDVAAAPPLYWPIAKVGLLPATLRAVHVSSLRCLL